MGDPVVAVVGLGYVGLPLAARAVEAGLRVVGVDIDTDRVAALNDGRSHIDDLADADVRSMRDRGFRATTSVGPEDAIDVFVICVPTPLLPVGGPDLSAVRAAGTEIARALRPGALVVLESTSYPGTTEDELRPILESGGLVAGLNFSLAFSPERIDPGRKTHDYASVPKIVSGLTPECRDAAAEFYGRLVTTVVTTRGLREAEMAKLLENTYRHVNIALVNEMARFCHTLGIDLWDAIEAAATKPFGFQRFDPGPGVGGHCIPIDPNYLSHYVEEQTGETFRFVHLAQEINAAMPEFVMARVQQLLFDRGIALSGARVLLIGVTYKADVADDRGTPALPIATSLTAAGAQVMFHDPLLPSWTAGDVPLVGVPSIDHAFDACDVAVLLQAHRILDLEMIASSVPALLDTRGVVPRSIPGVAYL
jgi:UDP-N-acetyl-D-glucosamine dehydrogenase